METNANGEQQQGEPRAVRSGSRTLRDFIPIYIPGVERGIIDRGPRKPRFFDFLKAQPNRQWLLKAGIRGRISNFASALRKSVRREGSSHGGLPTSLTRRFRVPFVRKVNWKFMLDYGKNWIKNPMNMALLVWLVFVAAGLVTLGLLMTGLLDEAIPKSSQRKRWTEIVNQILNALFTIMCLYQHPNICHHMIILYRWTPKDAVELRAAYCKSSAPRPHERVHMAIIITLLHLTCLSQYMLCALYWGWTSKNRPEWAEYLCIAVGIAAPIAAALYTVYGPLRKKIDPAEPELGLMTGPRASSVSATDDESQKFPNGLQASASTRVRVVVTEPQWLGGTFDCGDDVTVAYLSLFCTCCVFGWNMERLGFGNMYVHIVTFVLLCVAPLLVFSVSALNINDGTLKYVVGITGCVLCFCGLLYGGYWRIHMRRKFKLPGNPFCCGYPAVTDCFQWLFCWACTLAQEVRTGNYYEIEDDSVYRRSLEEEAREALRPLQREAQAGPRPSTDRFNPTIVSNDNRADDSTTELPSVAVDQTMSAPSPAVIDMDNRQQGKELKQ